jgi:translation elongation factor EF-G
MGYREAAASAVILEPIMKNGGNYTRRKHGDILGDINRRRGQLMTWVIELNY